MDWGFFLGRDGARYVAVGISDLKITTTDAKPRFTVDMLKDQLKTAQTYDLNEAKLPGTTTPPPPPGDGTPPADRERRGSHSRTDGAA